MRILIVGFGLAGGRIAVLWFLIFREWSHRQNIALLPLVTLLYPEGLLLPASFSWTWARAIGFSSALLLGSFLLAALFLVAIRALRL